MNYPQCNAEPQGPPFAWRDEEPFWSSQGVVGTCTKHTLAKAIYREISGYTNLSVSTRDLFQVLASSDGDSGPRGANPVDYNGRGRMVVSGSTGRMYEFHIRVKKVDSLERDQYHIVTLDLHYFLDGYGPGSWHALFNEGGNGDENNKILTFRNSWGENRSRWPIKVADLVRHGSYGYYVWVTDFKKLAYRSEAEEVYWSDR